MSTFSDAAHATDRRRCLAVDHTVALRPLPYPYQAMLAICSDLDETPDWQTYWETARFLNTTAHTSIGPGVGLEVGNSIYFDMPPEQFAYWNTEPAGREMVRTLIRSGHIDCLHSFGDWAATRDHAARSLDELARYGCHVEVWVDHGVAPTNLGADIMNGRGDLSGHPAYHADLLLEYGIRYVWRGRVTSVLGQNVPPRLGGLLNGLHLGRSGLTLARELAKQVLSSWGHRKYVMHRPNEVLRPVRLRDGAPVYEFLRCNPYWGGISCCETARGIGRVLTPALLDCLCRRQGVCILYTHLGKVYPKGAPFDALALAGLRELAEAHRAGRILVSTTRRVLGFCRAIREASFRTTQNETGLQIDVSTESSSRAHLNERLPAADLAGLTFYVDDPACVRLIVDGRDQPHLGRNGPDHTGRRSVSLPWRALEWPSL